MIARLVLADVPIGRCVRLQGRWGVVCGIGRRTTRVIDFWDSGREYVQAWMVVEVLS